jgi:hypothetical protein
MRQVGEKNRLEHGIAKAHIMPRRGANGAAFAQVNSQLRFSGFEVGLLLNFRQWPLKEGIKRVIHCRS